MGGYRYRNYSSYRIIIILQQYPNNLFLQILLKIKSTMMNKKRKQHMLHRRACRRRRQGHFFTRFFCLYEIGNLTISRRLITTIAASILKLYLTKKKHHISGTRAHA